VCSTPRATSRVDEGCWSRRPRVRDAQGSCRAAVANENGELLLIQRADSGLWLYPTGWCDVGYSAPEVVVKEVLEETASRLNRFDSSACSTVCA